MAQARFRSRFGYDSRGRRISATDQNNKTTIYAYDTESNLTDIWDANNSHHTQFQYIPGSQLHKTICPSGKYETYVFDGKQ